ncbi:MAG TPA: Holliday junction branch migration protein RuvA [Acidimicrobiales bacterium]|nr:Holliday junction branch migration protein RuvA [Acidimicrobiales bacterium]
MIGSLRGVLLDRLTSGELLVEVGGVGYRVSVPAGTLALVDGPGNPLFLHVHTHVRDDAIVLYGFATSDERFCFEALLGAHGVGPALALAILSSLSPVSLRRAVAVDDVDALTVVPGVGKKTAARLLLELKSRLALPEGEPEAILAAVNGGGHSARAEVKAALAGLGYGADEVREAVRELPDDGTVEDLLRAALRQMATAR